MKVVWMKCLVGLELGALASPLFDGEGTVCRGHWALNTGKTPINTLHLKYYLINPAPTSSQSRPQFRIRNAAIVLDLTCFTGIIMTDFPPSIFCTIVLEPALRLLSFQTPGAGMDRSIPL